MKHPEIFTLGKIGFDVTKVNDYTFLVNRKIELHPLQSKYRILATGKQGTYQNLNEFIKKQLSNGRV